MSDMTHADGGKLVMLWLCLGVILGLIGLVLWCEGPQDSGLTASPVASGVEWDAAQLRAMGIPGRSVQQSNDENVRPTPDTGRVIAVEVRKADGNLLQESVILKCLDAAAREHAEACGNTLGPKDVGREADYVRRHGRYVRVDGRAVNVPYEGTSLFVVVEDSRWYGELRLGGDDGRNQPIPTEAVLTVWLKRPGTLRTTHGGVVAPGVPLVWISGIDEAVVSSRTVRAMELMKSNDVRRVRRPLATTDDAGEYIVESMDLLCSRVSTKSSRLEIAVDYPGVFETVFLPDAGRVADTVTLSVPDLCAIEAVVSIGTHGSADIGGTLLLFASDPKRGGSDVWAAPLKSGKAVFPRVRSGVRYQAQLITPDVALPKREVVVPSEYSGILTFVYQVPEDTFLNLAITDPLGHPLAYQEVRVRSRAAHHKSLDNRFFEYVRRTDGNGRCYVPGGRELGPTLYVLVTRGSAESGEVLVTDTKAAVTVRLTSLSLYCSGSVRSLSGSPLRDWDMVAGSSEEAFTPVVELCGEAFRVYADMRMGYATLRVSARDHVATGPVKVSGGTHSLSIPLRPSHKCLVVARVSEDVPLTCRAIPAVPDASGADGEEMGRTSGERTWRLDGLAPGLYDVVVSLSRPRCDVARLRVDLSRETTVELDLTKSVDSTVVEMATVGADSVDWFIWHDRPKSKAIDGVTMRSGDRLFYPRGASTFVAMDRGGMFQMIRFAMVPNLTLLHTPRRALVAAYDAAGRRVAILRIEPGDNGVPRLLRNWAPSSAEAGPVAIPAEDVVGRLVGIADDGSIFWRVPGSHRVWWRAAESSNLAGQECVSTVHLGADVRSLRLE